MRAVAETWIFERYAADIWSNSEREAFSNWLATNPESGDIISGSGGCRKVRWAASGRGKRGETARVTEITITPAAEARLRVGLSQHDSAAVLGISSRTLQDWEQGRRKPTGAAKTLLRVACSHPEVLRELQP